MTCASAVFPSCVMVTAIFFTPNWSAMARVAPDSFSVGLPLGSRTTSMSTQRTPRAQPVPCLHRGFLGGKAPREAFRAVAMLFAVANLRRREQALEKRAAAARDGRFHAIHFGNVHAQADDHWVSGNIFHSEGSALR